MAKQTKNTLKNWFLRGCKPLASQFADWMDSYWHKDESIPAGSVENLQNLLDEKAAATEVTQLNNSVTQMAATVSGIGTDIDTLQDAMQETEETLAAHVADTVKHVTATERTAWNAKQNALTFDTTPTTNSTNPVTSGGIKSYVDGQIAEIPAAYHPKGSVTFANLPTEGMQAGDVYNVTDGFTIDSRFEDYEAGVEKTYGAGTNVAYTEGGKWDAQCGIVDLSGYQKKGELASADGSISVQTTESGTDLSVVKVPNALSVQLDSAEAQTFDGGNALSLNLTPESINAKRVTDTGNWVTGAVNAHYFQTDKISTGYAVGNYIPLMKLTSKTAGKMNVQFEIISREWGATQSYYGKYTFNSRSGTARLVCTEYFDKGDNGMLDLTDICVVLNGESTATIYRKVKCKSYSPATEDYFIVAIDGMDKQGTYCNTLYYTTSLAVDYEESISAAVSITPTLCATDGRGGSADMALYQPITDSTLNTTNKTVPGAINEVLGKIKSQNVEYFPYSLISKEELIQGLSSGQGGMCAWSFIPAINTEVTQLQFICTSDAGGQIQFALYSYEGTWSEADTTVPVQLLGQTEAHTITKGMNIVAFTASAAIDPDKLYFVVALNVSGFSSLPFLVRSAYLPAPSAVIVPFVVEGQINSSYTIATLTDLRSSTQLVNNQYPQGERSVLWFMMS